MKKNVVITIFDVESEAFQAFNELRTKIAGPGYSAPEASLIRNKGGNIDVLDGYSTDTTAGDGTAMGMVVGSLIGILGGPIGVILGAGVGAYAGSTSDADKAIDAVNAVAVVSSKLFEGETAIVALVEEDEPAFDAVFAAYKTTAIRYDAEDVAKEAEELRRLEEQVSEDVANEIKAQRKAEREEKAKKDFEEYEESVNRTMTQASPI
ncbi:MAG: DUF1269 domain-containing protein [Eggerthellaceae bacterium]|nr:DUF1269 domain-containing protein [Eggerthellaceae bacterium]